ncbi:DNA polymerase III subunit psi [Thalassotalea ponticola]|uniref:DNA polymerase III subunit psi n=1 Tax=Thalassotalea ponticola TaxID=1523392 RepID=UPI0025B6181D|nr:DNA polymerase III subunit psi [Thalassotalea ponticola]MDN3653859.1 DNA polymerase III subunit psi [Thalassotalea ponticola]
MTLTRKQFTHLQHMGITVWQRRADVFSDANNAESLTSVDSTAPNTSALANDISADTKQQPQTVPPKANRIEAVRVDDYPMFNDVLLALSVNPDQVTQSDDIITLPNLTWRFDQQADISYRDGVLTTPNLAALQASPALKRQLWFALCDYLPQVTAN